MTINYNIIACDGGGIRGLITALLLQDLITNPPPGSSSNLRNNVSLFAGTSTGGIIAIALAAGMDLSNLVRIYENNCSTIFEPYTPSDPSAALARKRLRLSRPDVDPDSLGDGLFYVMYTNAGLYKTVSDKLNNSSQFQANDPLSALTQGVMVTTFMMSDTSNDAWTPLALTNLPNAAYPWMTLIDASMCTSAAPIYFPPYGVPVPPYVAPSVWFADGGIFANNPSAFTLAIVLDSQVLQLQNKLLSNVRMLSIGTGATTDYVPSNLLSGTTSDNPFDWGADEWLDPFATAPEPELPLIAAMFDGQSAIADFQTSMILGSGQYQRANPVLSQTVNLDDCDDIPILENAAQDYIASQAWIDIKQWTYDNFV